MGIKKRLKSEKRDGGLIPEQSFRDCGRKSTDSSIEEFGRQELVEGTTGSISAV